MSRFRQLAPFLLPAIAVAACALPTDERATPYDRDNVPPAIANTTTTSTTTTTTVAPPTTTVAPPDSSGSTLPESTTSAPIIATAPVDLYYSLGLTDEMSRLKRPLPEDAAITLVLAQLESPSSDVEDFGLRTSVRVGMVAGDVVVDRGTATVALDGDIVDDMSEINLRRAVAQLVLTLTSFSTDDSGAIGRVRFEIDEEGFAVFVPAFGGSSDPGEELAFEDFAGLISSTSANSTTTTVAPGPTSSDPDASAG
jgi:Sporulation and spore germination